MSVELVNPYANESVSELQLKDTVRDAIKRARIIGIKGPSTLSNASRYEFVASGLTVAAIALWIIKGPRLHFSSKSVEVGIFFPLGIREPHHVRINLAILITSIVVNVVTGISTFHSAIARFVSKVKWRVIRYAALVFSICLLLEVFVVNPVCSPNRWQWVKTTTGHVKRFGKGGVDKVIELLNNTTDEPLQIAASTSTSTAPSGIMSLLGKGLVSVFGSCNRLHSCLVLGPVYLLQATFLILNFIQLGFLASEQACDAILSRVSLVSIRATPHVRRDSQQTTLTFQTTETSDASFVLQHRKPSVALLLHDPNGTKAVSVRMLSIWENGKVMAPIAMVSRLNAIFVAPLLFFDVNSSNGTAVLQTGEVVLHGSRVESYQLGRESSNIKIIESASRDPEDPLIPTPISKIFECLTDRVERAALLIYSDGTSAGKIFGKSWNRGPAIRAIGRILSRRSVLKTENLFSRAEIAVAGDIREAVPATIVIRVRHGVAASQVLEALSKAAKHANLKLAAIHFHGLVCGEIPKNMVIQGLEVTYANCLPAIGHIKNSLKNGTVIADDDDYLRAWVSAGATSHGSRLIISKSEGEENDKEAPGCLKRLYRFFTGTENFLSDMLTANEKRCDPIASDVAVFS